MKSTSPNAARGRPRDDSIDTAVREATRSLLADHRYNDIGIGQIAAAAGTTRQAVYRRWTNKAHVVLEALFSETNTVEFPDLGDLRRELQLAANALASEFNDPVAQSVVGGLLSDLQSDPQLHSQVRNRMLEPEHARVAAIFTRAVDRGEISAGFDIDVAVETIAGAVVYRTCFLGLPADEAFVETVIDLVIRPTTEEPS